MITLHYDGAKIDLPEGMSIDTLKHQIDATADGSGWLPITDADGTSHTLRVTTSTPIRFSVPQTPLVFSM